MKWCVNMSKKSYVIFYCNVFYVCMIVYIWEVRYFDMKVVFIVDFFGIFKLFVGFVCISVIIVFSGFGYFYGDLLIFVVIDYLI